MWGDNTITAVRIGKLVGLRGKAPYRAAAATIPEEYVPSGYFHIAMDGDDYISVGQDGYLSSSDRRKFDFNVTYFVE